MRFCSDGWANGRTNNKTKVKPNKIKQEQKNPSKASSWLHVACLLCALTKARKTNRTTAKKQKAGCENTTQPTQYFDKTLELTFELNFWWEFWVWCEEKEK
jgi:hypothetical protein